MTNKKRIKLTLIIGLIFLSVGGFLMHSRIHPPLMDADNLIPFLSGLVSIFIIPFLFWFRSTLILAYLINGFSVINSAILTTLLGSGIG